MRQDQLERLRAVQEELADVFFGEADTKKWPGMDTRDNRGDRVWWKKNANASLSLVVRIENLLALRDGRASGGPAAGQTEDDEAALDREIAATTKEAEAIAQRAIERAQGRRGAAAKR